MGDLGRWLLFLGLGIAGIGLVLMLAARFWPWLGHLPGDFRYESEHLRIYFPFATMLLVSLIASLVLNVLVRLFRR